MSDQNKLLIIGASAAVGCITLVVLGIGAMQLVSFRQEQQQRAQEQELKDQMALLDVVSKECQSLSQLVNRTQDFIPAFEESIQTFSSNATQVKDLDDIKAAASQYVSAVDEVVVGIDQLTADLKSAQIQNEQLTSYRDRYAATTKGFSEALVTARDAMSILQSVQTEDALSEKIEESQQQTGQAVQRIQNLSAEESNIVDEANNFCSDISNQRIDIQTELLSP